LGTPSRSGDDEGQRRRRRNWVQASDGFPGVLEDDMPRQNNQRKHGTTRRSPRPAGTAKTSSISRKAAKWRCAGEWGGWGRLSDDGSGHYNPNRSEGPWGRGKEPSSGGTTKRRPTRTQCRGLHHMVLRRRRKPSAKDGSKLSDATRGRRTGRHRLKGWP
jgi:hypothetical protein